MSGTGQGEGRACLRTIVDYAMALAAQPDSVLDEFPAFDYLTEAKDAVEDAFNLIARPGHVPKVRNRTHLEG